MLTSILPLSAFAADEEDEFCVVVSMEGLTLGQGMYFEPKAYTLDEINELVAEEGLGPYEQSELTAGIATLAFLLDNGIEYEMTGSWESDAYLASVKGVDTGILNIPSVITDNGGPSNDENDGNYDDYLGEFDYSYMSGWMVTVNDYMIDVGSAAWGFEAKKAEKKDIVPYIDLGNTYVVRWQFSLCGYGADLGVDTGWGEPAYFEGARKAALYAAYAKSTDAVKKAAALAVMEDLTATQAEVDAALALLMSGDADDPGTGETPDDPVPVEPPSDPGTVDPPAADARYKAILNNTLVQLAVTVNEPQFGTTGGEWTVLALARGGYFPLDHDYFKGYYSRIVDTVRTTAASVNMNGALHKTKSTENSRLIMALSAIGKDSRDVGGVDLVGVYSANGMSWIKKQGINGPIFALIALDSWGYETADDSIRQQCIDFILEKELAGGGWALSGSNADPDITGMALQALAKYRNYSGVADAAERAFNKLSSIQNETGGFASWGTGNSESIAQVIVACTAWGIDPDKDSRFVKNGNSALDALLTFYVEEGKGFAHVLETGGGYTGGEINAMATDQACYALVAYDRFVNGQNALYDMSDTKTYPVDPDTDAPVLSEGSAIRLSLSEGSVSFTTSEAGSYYYQVVDSGSVEPSIDTNGPGTAIEAPGMVVISLSYLTSGAKDVYIKVKDAAGNVSSTLRIQLPAESSGGGQKPKETISVSFRLIGSTLSKGDVDLGTGDYKGAKYQTWIKTVRRTLDKGATVYDLFTAVLDEAGLRYTGAENNYVETIYAPEVLGGYALSEFTNGQRSGWMYTINGSHPGLGLKEQALKDGDVVIWHYVNDYAHEVADWFDDPNYPAIGDGTYYNMWLSAPDVEPSASENTKGPAGGTSGNTELNPNAQVDKDGKAIVSISKDSFNEVLEQAAKEAADTIVIAPEITGTATKVLVEMPTASLASISSDTNARLKVETPIGSVVIPNEVLAAVAAQASDTSISVVLESVDVKTLTAEQQKLVGDNIVFDISILSGDKYISSFGGNSITISLPYTLKTGESADGVTVWYLSDDGKLTPMACTYDMETGLASFTTTHLSNYVVGYDVWKNPFTDVKEDDWFYSAVKYAVQNELFNGISETEFSPDTDMTRAMLVTVLYRLDGKPSATGANIFTDVEAGQWYTDAVVWASKNGIVNGYGDNLFGKDNPVTREQMAAMLLRYADYKKYDISKTNDLASYTDSGSISPYALGAMKWANAEGLITGRTASTLAPAGTATRAEVATVLMRFAENVLK